jgi:hypothetical protein
MKKVALFSSFLCFVGSAFCQQPSQSYDSSFKALYKAVALRPGRLGQQGILNDSVIKRWDKDIVIYIEGGTGKTRREILGKLTNTIALLSPALNNKIKISFAKDKASANYLINLNPGGRSGWYVRWDGNDNIYSCILSVNTAIYFNLDQQTELISHYFLKSLGDFGFSREEKSELRTNNPSIASNMRFWRQDINDIDLKILKLHYADEIKPGMAEKDIDHFFEKHSSN